MSKGYVEMFYNEDIRPLTSYPARLTAYLFARFAMCRGTKLLDVGCGRGEFAKGFLDLGLDVSALDRELYEAGLFEGIDLWLADTDTDTFPFPDESFDVVFTKSVIEHYYAPDHFIGECRRVLAPGGRIIVMTPDWYSQSKTFYDDFTHRRPYTVESLRDLLRMYGFENVSAERFYQLPVVWRFPALKIVSRMLQAVVPVTLKPKNKFIRWSIELMVLGTGIKEAEGKVRSNA